MALAPCLKAPTGQARGLKGHGAWRWRQQQRHVRGGFCGPPLEAGAAARYPEIVLARRQAGNPIEKFDALIAATALAAGASIEDPPSRTRHLIGNLEVVLLENGEVEAKTAFLVHRSHLETDYQLLSGCREDLLRKVNRAWKVARRTIVLDANILLDKNLSLELVFAPDVPAAAPMSNALWPRGLVPGLRSTS
jgi:hypothetical protein